MKTPSRTQKFYPGQTVEPYRGLGGEAVRPGVPSRTVRMMIRSGAMISVQEFRLLFHREPERVFRGHVPIEISAAALAALGNHDAFDSIALNGSSPAVRRWAQRQARHE